MTLAWLELAAGVGSKKWPNAEEHTAKLPCQPRRP